MLELVERPRVAAARGAPLEDLVRHELDDERAAREARGERGAPDHARRVHDVGAPGSGADERGRAQVPEAAERRAAHRHGIRRAAGSASAVVTTSTPWPRATRKSASAGAWLAGPPGSGGQMPDTTTILTRTARPARGLGGARPRRAAARTTSSQATANTSVEASTPTAAPVAPHFAAEHGDERDRHDRLETVRDDPQPRPADRDRQRLRPADDELHGRREQDDAGRGDGPVVLLAEDEVDEPGHRHEEHGTATSITPAAHLE